MAIILTLQPDVVVTDVAMSERDGFDLLTNVRAQPSLPAKIPVLAVTGYARPEDEERARKAGFAGHVTKPVDIDALVSAICKVVPDHG